MSALTKITSIAKRIKKRFPNKHKKWIGYVKDAAKVYNKGGSGPKPRKARAKAKPVRKRRKVARKRVVKAVRKRTVYRTKTVVRRVGAKSGKMDMGVKVILGIGAVLVAAALLKVKQQQPPDVPAGYINQN